MDPGETVALVGKRGCGKTTIVNLLQRFYDVTEGQILLDHRNIRSYNVGWLRGQMGVVGQDPVLFQATVAQNIRYGLATATQFDIEQSAITANAHQFILKLPRKYDTMVGEHGYRLTSSQVQRIAIARALVRNPRIFLMDDAPPVASIEMDADLKGALEKACRGRTALIVAQRLSTIRCADKILVMRSGKMVDFGTHNELIKRASGAYLELLTTQITAPKEAAPLSPGQLRISSMHRGALTSTKQKESLHGRPDERVSGDKRPDSPLNSAQNAGKSLRTKLLHLTDPERGYMTAGCLCALLMGLSVPIYAIFLGNMLQGLGSGNADLIMSTTIFYCLLFLMVGVLTGFCSFLQTFSFSVVGENLTRRLRKITFSAMMRQEVAWYDEEDNTPERLCTFLFSDTARVHGAFSALVACLVMAFYWDWHLGFIVLAFVPLVLLSTYLESRMLRGKLMSSKQALDNSTRIAVEAIQNIRTVASLHQEEVFCANYVQSLTEPQRIMKRKAILRGFSFGVAQCIPSMAYATSLLYGSILVGRCDLLFGNLFKVIEGVILGTAMIGQAVAYSPDYHKAKAAAQRIFRLIDRVPKIDFMDKSGITMQSIRGFLTFNEVSFHYPHHPEVRALDHVTFSVEPGQTVALVGPNYSGKSTSVHLVERFYDITEGEIVSASSSHLNRA
ncbi:ATP-dependent translocase ABCB1 [Ixodes scapularis]